MKKCRYCGSESHDEKNCRNCGACCWVVARCGMTVSSARDAEWALGPGKLMYVRGFKEAVLSHRINSMVGA